MITERALLDAIDVLLLLDAYGAGSFGGGIYGDGETTPLTPDMTRVQIRRGGIRQGLGVKTDVGFMTITLLNAQDPLDGGALSPGLPIRATAGEDVFTGRIVSIGASYPLDKQTGDSRAFTVVTIADAVAIHAATTRYGVSSAEGYETFEERIERYSSTAQAPIEAPDPGAPIVRYAL